MARRSVISHATRAFHSVASKGRTTFHGPAELASRALAPFWPDVGRVTQFADIVSYDSITTNWCRSLILWPAAGPERWSGETVRVLGLTS